MSVHFGPEYAKDADKIKELLALGLSVRKIAVFLGYSNHIGLNTYIRKREVRKALIGMSD